MGTEDVKVMNYILPLRGVFYFYRIPKGNMKSELNQTQAIYPPEGSKPKVCVTTEIVSRCLGSLMKHEARVFYMTSQFSINNRQTSNLNCS